MSSAEAVFDSLLEASHLAAPHELPGLAAEHAARLGADEGMLFLADLQQAVLVPFTGSSGPARAHQHDTLPIDTTLAGRAFQRMSVQTQDLGGRGGTRVWLPLLNGTARLGVLAVTLPDAARLTAHGGLLERRLRRLAAVLAELVATKTPYADTIPQVHRQVEMSLAAEMQWALLPPLTFACRDVIVTAALEPAYTVAGDSVDYAVNESTAWFAVFDGMGHGLQSAQLAALAVAAYRNARRAGRTLTEAAREIDDAVRASYRGRTFITAVLAELEPDTGLLRWICAGHPRPLLLRGGHVVKQLHAPVNIPFGVDAGDRARPYEVGADRLQPGDRLVLYTDGVTEARAPDGTLFGLDRLVDLIARKAHDDLPPPETVRRVIRDLLLHQQGQLQDDATVLVVEWRSDRQHTLLPARHDD